MLITDGENLRNTVLTAPIGICILDANTLVVEIVNDKFIEVAGKPYEAIHEKFYWDAFAEARQYFEAALAGVVQTGEAYHANEVELMLIRHGKEETIFVTFIYSPVKNDEGKVVKVAVWVLENTKQVNARQEIEAGRAAFKRERDRLNDFFMQAPAGICILDGPDLVFELVNPGYQQLLPGRKLLNRPIFEALPELVGTPLQDTLLNVYRMGESFEFNELLIPVAEYEGGPTRDRYFSFNYQARRDENDDIDGIFAFVFEVTGLMNVQQEQAALNEELSATNEELSASQLGLQQLNDSLAESEHRTRSIVANAPFPIAVYVGREMLVTLANQAIIDIWGKGPDVIGKLFTDVLPELQNQQVFTQLRQVYNTGKAFHARNQRLDLVMDGELKTFYFNYSLTALTDNDGKVYGVMNTGADVTDAILARQEVELVSKDLATLNEELAATNEEMQAVNEELTASNEELEAVNDELLATQQRAEEGEVALRLAIDAADFGTWFIHSVTREFITDARLKELFGYYPDEPLSIEQAIAQITEEYRGYVATKLENAIYNGGDYDVTYPVVGLHDERLRWLRAIGNLKADPSGAFSAFTGVVMDITEQVLAAKKIELAEKSLRMAVEAAGLGTYFINTTDRLFVASPSLKEFFGFRPDEEVPYEAAINQIHEDYRQKAADMVEAAFTKGARFDMEYPIIGYHDGKIRWVRGIGEMQHSDGKDYFTGVLHEITEKKQDEIRKNDFIGMVSHELKTPLTSLTAIIQVANTKLKTSKDAFLAGAMEKANAQVKKMSNMINGFLNISRLESGKILITKQDFDLDKLLTEMIDEAKITLATHTINFNPCGPLQVNADRDKIGSVISNLLNNAVKYSPKGKFIEITCTVAADTVTVSVKDEGMGINPEDLGKIFERYYRVEASHTYHISGFGIGLYLSAEIIQRHNGKIWVESESGLGSTFYFSLPLR